MYYRFEYSEQTSTHIHGFISCNHELELIQGHANEFFKSLWLRNAKHTKPCLIEAPYDNGELWQEYIDKQDKKNPINMFV